MNRMLVSTSRVLGLAVGFAALTGCHEVREFNPNGVANFQEFKQEQVLIEKLKANPNDYDTLMKIAEIRAASGRERVARYNYSQVMAADSSNNPELQLLQSQAEVHYAILKATYEGKEAIADTGFQFNLKKADQVLEGDQK